MEHITDKDKQKALLLFVFALGALITYVVFLFLPASHIKSVRNQKDNSEVMEDSPLSNDQGMMGHDMGSAMDTMTSDLIGKQGAEFDKAFLEDMIVHHEGAVAMAQMALTSSKDQNVLTLSQNIIKAQNEEIKMMKLWLSKMEK